MNMEKVARSLLRVLAVLAVLAGFVVLDWYPTVKELGRLRRERGDLEGKITEYEITAAKFNFPDKAEQSILLSVEAELHRALPLVENDAAWTAIGLTDMHDRVKEDRLPHANFIFNWFLWGTELGTAGPGRPDPLADWFWNRQYASGDISPGRFLWHGVLSDLEPSSGQRLANRYIIVALAAPLPALLNFINHLSWGKTRLEVIRLHLEPGTPLTMAWVVCRGSYLVRGPSNWLVGSGRPAGEGELLIDSDSPLLWQRADPLFAPAVEKRELPPEGSPW